MPLLNQRNLNRKWSMRSSALSLATHQKQHLDVLKNTTISYKITLNLGLL